MMETEEGEFVEPKGTVDRAVNEVSIRRTIQASWGDDDSESEAKEELRDFDLEQIKLDQ